MNSPRSSSPRPSATVGRILDDLGSTFLRPLVLGSPGRAVEGVVIHDPLDDQHGPASPVVLGVGVSGAEQVAELADRAGARGAALLIVREPVEAGATLTTICRKHGMTVAGLTRGASWAQLTAMLRSLLAEGDVGGADDETVGGLPSGDLFGLANAIGSLVDAPVTIEDRSSRVLAFSGRQDEADPSRIETILERQVPERYARLLDDQGFFSVMYAADRPVSIRLRGEDAVSKLRVAMAVRAGTEVLGSIWVAVDEELDDERTAALQESAKLVALHLLRIRAGADASRRLRADLLGTALEGGVRARHAVTRLGLAGVTVAVLAMQVGAPSAGSTAGRDDLGTLGQDAVERERRSDALALHLTSVHPKAATALLGEVTYGLIPVTDGLVSAERIARDFVARTGPGLTSRVGIGPPAADVDALAAARRGADRALRVLMEGRTSSVDGAAGAVAVYRDVQIQSFLLELRDRLLSDDEQPSGPVSHLVQHDRAQQTSFVQTLRAWLDAHGDVAAAAGALHIHPNTLRYRLRRIESISTMDLADPEARFAAQLHLRLLPPS
ncbi:CdaR family transcriptional regulator [uncultured Serinicoccus sp.]|uniref:PucR family transcriptional regulator n=1 Tax=uncultured Serinicoccus sp. TaxID=735514 RepID=UPI0026131E33|nr:PucR family transcriptional regulator [uncultured Serinicoccus sp.]